MVYIIKPNNKKGKYIIIGKIVDKLKALKNSRPVMPLDYIDYIRLRKNNCNNHY